MLKRNDNVQFDLLAYFEGETLAEGVFESRSGEVKRRFHVEMTGRTEAGTLVLDERFLFDNGERQQRCWRLARTGATGFTGHCEDAVRAADGHFAEGCAYMRSALRLKVGRRLIPMQFDDVFYDTGAGTVMNRSTVSKWGFRLGQVLILFRKP